MPKPRVIYEPKPGSPLAVDRPFYDRLADETRSRTLVEQFVVPMRSGRAWPVRAGQLFRIVAVEGPQVADFNAWNLGHPRERFWAARQAAPPRARHHARPAVVLPAVPPADAHDHQRHDPLRARRGRGGLP